MNTTVSKLAGLVWPLTRHKLHRLLHLAGLAVTAGIMAAVWVSTKNLPLGEHIGATALPLIPLLTKWQALFSWADANVDKLPIPESDSGKVVNGASTGDEITTATRSDTRHGRKPKPGTQKW